MIPPFYREWLLDLGLTSGGKAVPEWSVDAAIDLMGANDTATGILSVSTPAVGPAADAADAARRARGLNEFTAGVVRDHPQEFGFFATVPMRRMDSAVEEAVYALDVLGADGVVLLANYGGVYLGDARFDPFMAEMNRRGVVVFVHPAQLPAEPLPGVPAHAIDFLLDTTRAALNLARNGCMERYGQLRILLSHGGGFMPFAAQRMAVTASAVADDDDGLARLARFYFDTALTGSEFALPSLLAFADTEKITFGSDFPYASAARSNEFTRRLDAHPGVDHEAVNRKNAEALFPRLALPVPAVTRTS